MAKVNMNSDTAGNASSSVPVSGNAQELPVVHAPNNSNSSRSAEPKTKAPEKVVDGHIAKGHSNNAVARFVRNDLGKAVTNTVRDVLLPAAKDMVFDAFSDTMSRIFYGGGAARSSRRGGYSGGRTSYASYYDEGRGRRGTGRPRDDRDDPPARRNSIDVDGIVVPSRQDAERVLYELKDYIQQYGNVAVDYFKGLVNITADWNDNRWGWENLDDAGYRPTRGGFLLELPRPVHLS